MLKNGICVRICSKFSVKCEASYKNIVKVRYFNACHLQIGRFGTYRQVLHLTITYVGSYRTREVPVMVITYHIPALTPAVTIYFKGLGNDKTLVYSSLCFSFSAEPK